MWRRFLQDTQGAMTILTMLGFVTFVVAAGIAVDTARGWRLKVHLQHALDSAGLAAAVTTDNTQLDTEVQAFFNQNFGSDFFGATVSGPNYVVSADQRIVNLDATAIMPTHFMRLVGIETMNVRADTEITRESRGLELALVLDNTGSMAGGGKIEALRDAATILINNMYGANETLDDLWVSLVPYSATVNIGASYTGWLVGYNPSDYTPTSWKGCVEARAYPNDTNDVTAAGGGGWAPYFWDDAYDNNWDLGGGLYDVDESQSAGNNGTGPNLGCATPITPLIKEKTTLLNTIAAMLPWSRGGTMSDVGMAWGWRTISPSWRGLWNNDDPSTLPLDYNEPLMDKVVILLTDGVNQFYDYQGDGQVNGSDYTAHGRLGEGRVDGATTYWTAKAAIDGRLLEICTNMKNAGIKIYTITFQVSDSSTRTLFENCATDPSYYFNSPDNAQLQEVFRTISDTLAHLYISK